MCNCILYVYMHGNVDDGRMEGNRISAHTLYEYAKVCVAGSFFRGTTATLDTARTQVGWLAGRRACRTSTILLVTGCELDVAYAHRINIYPAMAGKLAGLQLGNWAVCFSVPIACFALLVLSQNNLNSAPLID